MTTLNKKQVLQQFENATNDQLFCVFCYDTLIETKEGTLYCPNEMCLNERHYNKQGIELDGE